MELTDLSLKPKSGLLVFITMVMGVVWLTCLVMYGKMTSDCHWFGISVSIYSVIAIVIVLFAFSKLEWYRYRYRTAPWRIIGVAIVGFVLSLFMGIYFTEPNERPNNRYDYSRTRTGYYYYYYFAVDTADSASSLAIPDMDFGDDGEALAYLFLIILVIVLVLASAFVPHFWVLAGAVLLAVMTMITYREMTLELYPRWSGTTYKDSF